MAGLLENQVDRLYAEATDVARRTVAAAPGCELYDVGTHALPATASRERYRAAWRVVLSPADPVGSLLIAVPWTFPDELPDVFVEDDIEYAGARIPHLDQNRQLCTYDDALRFPNPSQPGEAVLAVIERARETIRDGLAGTNRAEYWDEFDAYWSDGAKNIDRAFSIVAPSGPHRRIVIVPVSPEIGMHRRLFAEDDRQAKDFLSAIDRVPQNLKSAPALYLHLEALPTINIRTNVDAVRALAGGAQQVLFEYLDDVKRPSPVLFSLPIGAQRIFGAWRHEEFGFDVYRGKNSRRVRGEIRGFRKGRLRAEEELTAACAGERLGRYLVRRVDPERLAARTRGDVRKAIGPTNIVGCGSVGGIVARTIASDRPEFLRLIDNEVLEVQNVPRHVCDLTAVGTNKAEAVRALVRRSAPSLAVEAHPTDILDMLRVNPGQLSPADRTIVAVASVAVERRMNAFSRNHDIGELVFVWIEPHAVAGHAVIIPRGAVGCFECLLSDDFTLKRSVLTNITAFNLRDSGCGASFVPYAGIDLDLFSVAITREVLRDPSSDRGSVVTWIGDLTAARHNGWGIRTEWNSAADYSIHRTTIDANPSCPVCGGA